MTTLLVLIIVITLALLLRYARPGDGQRLFGRPQSEEARWEEKVLRLTRGDRGALERALRNRAQQFPQVSRTELLRRIHDEYLKDRG